jgi:hypothetical protein
VPNVVSQNDEPKKSVTNKDDLSPTPGPPIGLYPFKEGAGYKPDDYVNKLPKSEAAESCKNKVTSLEIHDKRKVVGNLKFNLRPRGDGNAAEMNGGNTDLGPVFEEMTLTNWYFYKYEVEISFTAGLEDTFYGQMITDPFTIGTKPDVQFHDDTPANDWINKEWQLKPSEKKTDFPVIEIQGNTVRWIDSPGGTTFKVANTTQIIIVYAGACGKLTHLKIIKIEYPKGKKPKFSFVDPPENLKDEVKSFKFKPS